MISFTHNNRLTSGYARVVADVHEGLTAEKQRWDFFIDNLYGIECVDNRRQTESERDNFPE